MECIPLRAPDELSDLWHKDVHCCYCFVIVIELHVEGFDPFGVINHYGGTPVYLKVRI